MKCHNAICKSPHSDRSQAVLMGGAQVHRNDSRLAVCFFTHTLWASFSGSTHHGSLALRVALGQLLPCHVRGPPWPLSSALKGRNPHTVLSVGHRDN
jgi:hypothetical protein